MLKVIKKINNNVALCIDDKNREVIAFGKGIGFNKTPYLIEEEQIHRVYYDIEDTYVKMINDIPEEVIEIAARIVEYAKEKLVNFNNSNTVITLADHINFAIKRHQEKMNVVLPIINDVQYLYDTEMDIGIKALSMIKDELNIELPESEAIYIALHIINAELTSQKFVNANYDEKIIDDITDIVENNFKIQIEKKGISYSRFITHLRYLLKRGEKNELDKDKDMTMYMMLKYTMPDIYACVVDISKYLEEKMSWILTDEECFYIMIHINRLCDRENYIK